MNAQNQGSVWGEMYRTGEYDTLVRSALPLLGTDGYATRWFMRMFAVTTPIFFLSPETIEQVRAYANGGEPHAQFAMGRYLVTKQPSDDSDNPAKKYFEISQRQGLPEATVALAQAAHYGDFGPRNRDFGDKMLNVAIDKGCDLACQYFIKEVIFGLHNMPANPEQALQFCNMFIETRTKEYGMDEVDPRWYYLKGCAEQTLYGWTHGGESFRMAADRGYITAYMDLSIARSHNDAGQLVNQEELMAGLREGAEHNCRECLAELATTLWNNNGEGLGVEKDEVFNQVSNLLYKAETLGSGAAARKIGDLTAESGNMEMAFRYYCRGTVYNSMPCCELAFAMMYDETVGQPLWFRDYVALRGARLGSELLKEQVVLAYREGRLNRYATEIEEDYIPKE